MLPSEWPPLTSDVIGDAATRCHEQVVAIQPWGILRGANGHVCLAVRSIDVLDPASTYNRGWEQRRGRSLVGAHGGIYSIYPIRIHITLVDSDEYKEITNSQMDAAKSFIEPWVISEQAAVARAARAGLCP